MDISKYTNRIEQAEAARAKVQEEYDGARNYYEDEQTPSGVPSDKDYIQENIITDTIDRTVGQFISGDINSILIGGGEIAKPIKELHDDILEVNNFSEVIIPDILNKFCCEGLGGIKFVDNPFKQSKYGVGFPEIYSLELDEILLDPNSKSGMHYDDLFRIHPKRVRLEDALEKWGRDKKGKKNELWSEIEGSVRESRENETEKFVDVYEMEEAKKVYYTENEIRKEKDVYYISKIINKTVMVEKPTKTGYPCFRIIPMIHTPRRGVNFGGYPMGLYKKLGQQQDQLNITSSITLEMVKSSIRLLVTATGQKITPSEELEIKRRLSENVAFINFKTPGSNIRVHPSPTLPPSLIQWYQWQRQSFDEIKGSSGQAQQFQSAASGQLSGKAVSSLQSAGLLPEYPKKVNVQYALKQLSLCIFHYIKKMKHPFSINRTIEGNDTNLMFNNIPTENTETNDYNILSQKEKLVNSLSELGEVDVKIKIEMNLLQYRQNEMNKAFMIWSQKGLALVDFLKKAYPDEWKEKYENIKAEQSAMGLVQEMVEIGGEEFVNLIAQNINQYKGMFKNGQYQGDKKE